MRTFHRVAFLMPSIAWEGADQELIRVGALQVWTQLLDVCMRVPSLSVATPQVVGGSLPWGMPSDAAKRQELATAFETWRRDEFLWVDVAIRASGASVTLHVVDRRDAHRTFAAVGADLGSLLQQVTSQWLEAGGLGAHVGSFESWPVAKWCEAMKVMRSLVKEQDAHVETERAEVSTPKLLQDAASAEESDSDEDDSDEDDSDDDESDDDESDDDDSDDDVEDGFAGEVDDEEVETSAAAEQRLTECLTALGRQTTWSTLRTAQLLFGGTIAPRLRELDADHPISLWTAFEKTRAHDPDFVLLRSCIDAAPGWATPHTAVVFDEDELSEPESDDAFELRPTFLEQIASVGLATFANPVSHEVGTTAAWELVEHDRVDEALRLMRRRVRLFGSDSSEHIELMRLHESAERIGDWVHEARAAARRHGCPMDPGFYWYPDQILIDLGESDALMQAGRLEEAIQLRQNRLHGLSGSWPRHTGILEKWKRSPSFVAWSYAREGFYRGEDPRTVEGFGRAEPDDAVDLAMLLDALVATGRERETPFAWAHFGIGMGFASATSRLKAVRALAAAGAWRTALEQLLELVVCSPQRGDEAERAHVARMLSGVPEEVVTSLLGELLDARHLTIGWFLGRQLADFWPGAAKSRVVTWALGKPEGKPAARPEVTFPRIDAATAERLQAYLGTDAPTLEAADRLVNGWPELVFGGEANDVVARLVFVAARSLDGYLRATLQTPSPLAGAFRTIAAEALQALARRAHDIQESMAHALLATLEPLWPLVHPRLAAHWLGVVERALHLEELLGGGLDTFLKNLPEANARLISPERLALMSFEAGQLMRQQPEGFVERLAPLLESLVFATGAAGTGEWATITAARLKSKTLHEDDALDLFASAAFVGKHREAESSLHAALAFFAAGDGEVAFTLLCAGLGNAAEEYRDKALELLKAPFAKAKLGVPFEFQKAANAAFQALQKGDPVKAERAARWLVAQESDNEEAHRNLGLALAAQGRAAEALASLVDATPEQATQILAGVLHQGGKLPEALSVLDYASRWYTRADQWLTYGGIVYAAMDNPRTVKAYATAYQLDPSVFDTSQLNAYAGVLDEVGDSKTCETIANALIKAAGKDLLWLTNGWHHLACACIGLGRHDEAVKLMKKAIEKNPMPENNEIFAKTMERAKKKQRFEAPPQVPTEPVRHDAYLLAETGDLAAVRELATSEDWNARRAALRAARYRYGSDDHTPVTKTARDAAAMVLEQSVAQSAPLATVCRSFALDLRGEGLDASVERPPDLGDRLTRHAFYEEFRSRGGVIVGQAPDTRVPFDDRVIFEGQPFGSTGEYVTLVKDVATLPFAEALKRHGLTMPTYLEVCARWGPKLDVDAALRKNLAAGLA